MLWWCHVLLGMKHTCMYPNAWVEIPCSEFDCLCVYAQTMYSVRHSSHSAHHHTLPQVPQYVLTPSLPGNNLLEQFITIIWNVQRWKRLTMIKYYVCEWWTPVHNNYYGTTILFSLWWSVLLQVLSGLPAPITIQSLFSTLSCYQFWAVYQLELQFSNFWPKVS